MKLLMLDQFAEVGGAQQCLLDLLPAIGERGWEALVALPGPGEMATRVESAGFRSANVDCGPYRSGRKSLDDFARFLASTPRLAGQIRRLADDLDADAIYVNGPRLLPAAARLNRPVVFHAHSYLPPGPVRRLCGWALRRAGARVIGNCHFVADPWRQCVGREMVDVRYNGVEGPANFAPRRCGIPARVGCIGRIAPEKGQLEFVKAAAVIGRELPQCRFVVYGATRIADPGYEREVRAAAATLPIEFRGWVDDVYTALAELDVLLVPSAPHEATTRVILEAFAAGVPVIAPAAGGIPEVVEDGRTGILCGTAVEMARAAVGLLCDDRRYAAMAAAARESWRARFRLARWQNEVLDCIATDQRLPSLSNGNASSM